MRRARAARRAPATRRRARTLWGGDGAGSGLAVRVLSYTADEDRVWDARLLRWDLLGSLGHVEGLRASRIISDADARRLRAGLRAALTAAERGRLAVGPAHEDVHTAVEDWLTRRAPGAGERLHTGRSRNDQIACDLRLYLKDRLLTLHSAALDLAQALVDFAARHRAVLWPGYTHQRRAMPSSVGAWALGYAEGLLDTAEALPALWTAVDRSPLGSAAGYGVPLPLRREATARALGFGSVDHAVTATQNGRGKLEAAALFWCSQLGHELSKLAQDLVLSSAEEFGYLVLPAELATGSSIMPHKRNPDLFELTRGRAAALDADLVAVLQLKARLPGGYHRDFQLLKEPLMRGLDRAEAMLDMMALALPRVGVDRARAAAALDGGALATDEVMRRVEAGRPFRAAYREVKAALARGEEFAAPPARRLIARRRSSGGLGNLALPAVRARLRRARAWGARERRKFDAAMARLAGRVRPRGRPARAGAALARRARRA
ncbi:MAG TPA: lyase family protein [Gemmatimonadales bacterium]|nr:lyase family protein [Gemmatimonadales bacterium]